VNIAVKLMKKVPFKGKEALFRENGARI